MLMDVLKPRYKADEKLKEEIIKFAKKKLPGYYVPKHIEFVEDLPATPYGKLDKKALREKYKNLSLT